VISKFVEKGYDLSLHSMLQWQPIIDLAQTQNGAMGELDIILQLPHTKNPPAHTCFPTHELEYQI
jgi:hypothetical protein